MSAPSRRVAIGPRFCPAAQFGGVLRFFKTTADEAFQIGGVGELHGGFLGKHGMDDVAEIPGIRAERYSRAVGCRLDHVLPAAKAETPAHEGNLHGSPPGPKFAHSVDQ